MIYQMNRAEKRLKKIEEKQGNDCISVILLFRDGRKRTLKTKRRKNND